jgi:NADH-quinone oxidoreductase subunit F
MTIAAFATGCEKGYVYIRGEYPLALERVETALAAARARGLLGPERVGQGIRLRHRDASRGRRLHLRRGDRSLQLDRRLSRRAAQQAPLPVEKGLFQKPTVINNVETLVNVPQIVLEGGAAFAAIGTEQSTGPKLFCLSGHVARPGVYEVPFGATLRQMIDLAEESPAVARSRPCSLGAPPARSSPPPSSMFP